MMWNIMDIKVTRSDDDVLSRIEEDMMLPVIVVAVFFVDSLVTMAFIVGGHKVGYKDFRVIFIISSRFLTKFSFTDFGDNPDKLKK